MNVSSGQNYICRYRATAEKVILHTKYSMESYVEYYISCDNRTFCNGEIKLLFLLRKKHSYHVIDLFCIQWIILGFVSCNQINIRNNPI